jgi:glycosyltransferase involved in cell wall biosynthesis
VDGYSTDGSWEYIQQFAEYTRFLIIRGTGQGIYPDWNECLKYVNTEYFYFLTSDDTCYPELVSKTTEALDRYPDVDACHFQFALINRQGSIKSNYEVITEKFFPLYTSVNKYAHRRSGITEFILHTVYRSLYISMTSLVFRRNLIDKIQGFPHIYGTVGDCDYLPAKLTSNMAIL